MVQSVGPKRCVRLSLTCSHQRGQRDDELAAVDDAVVVVVYQRVDALVLVHCDAPKSDFVAALRLEVGKTFR